MKRIILLFTGLLISLTTVSARTNADKFGNYLDDAKSYKYSQPIRFIERNIEFLIFPDGSFDFNTNSPYSSYRAPSSYYRDNSFERNEMNSRHKFFRRNYNYHSTQSEGVLISRDRNGKVRRIGNLFLNYDRYGKITRAGNIYMNYNRGRHGDLRQVGGLHVIYNDWGEIINTQGQVNRHTPYPKSFESESCDIQYPHTYYKNERKYTPNSNNRYNNERHQLNDKYYYKKKIKRNN